MEKLKVLGVMGGNGVILHPFKEYLIGNIEIRSIFHSKGDIQWKLNFNDIPYYKTIKEIRQNVKSDIDVIIGAPDCGHSSILSYSRRKALSDPKDNKSLELYSKCVNKFKPTFFLMENLPKLLDTYDNDFCNNLFKGYNLRYLVSSVSGYGNSQKDRIRLLIIGINREKIPTALDYIQYQISQIYKINELKTTGELLKGLYEEDIEFGHVRENLNSIITLYAGFKISLKDVQKIWQNNPKLSRWVVEDRKFTTAPGVYRNTQNKFPATARKANRQFNPEGLQMSPRELARIQGVPDSFKIYIDPNNIQYWINKGRATVTKTPPYEIGQWFFENMIKIYNHEHN